MAETTKVSVKFDTKASEKFLMHKGVNVALDSQGKGSFDTDVGEYDLILFGISEATPGTTAEITLSVPSSRTLQILGHPIEGEAAQGKTVWGSSRFFRVV